MVKASQHLAGSRCQVKLKMFSLYVWLVLCGFTEEVFCADGANGKQIKAQIISTPSSSDDVSIAQSYTEDISADMYDNEKSYNNELYRFSRSVPRDKTTSKSSDSESEDHPKHDYVLKIPLSLLRLLKWEKRYDLMPVLRFGRLNNENQYNMEDNDDIFQSFYSEFDISNEENMEELFKEVTDEMVPPYRNSRSMLLLSSPKSEEPTKEKPPQTFVLPYPRPGRSNKHIKTGKSKIDQLILPYPRPGRSKNQKEFSKIAASSNNKKYMLPTARLGRSFSDPTFENERVIDDWLSNGKSNIFSPKLNKGKMPEKAKDENEDNAFFVIPYPRPGKRAMFKLRNRNQESKNSENEIADYVLPYPRPGKKSGREKMADIILDRSRETGNTDHQNFMLPYPRPGRAPENSLNSQDMPDFFAEEYDHFISPYVRTRRSFDNMVPYPRPGRSFSLENEASHPSYNDMIADNNEYQTSEMEFKNSEDPSPDILRFKRSSTVVPYPRMGRSNVVPYPRPGRADSVVPYPRLGRSNSVVPYPRLGRSDAVVPYPRLGRSTSVLRNPNNDRSKRNASVVPYPRLGRSESVVPYPRPGRSESVVPYSRLGRAESVVPYPRPGRSESIVPYPRPGRSESVVPYPRPGRSESLVPYPRPGRAESLVPYPRPGRAESLVPYPRPGRTESLVPYPRPGRSDSLVPYPRPGRSDSLVPYPRPGRSHDFKPVSSNKYDKTEYWLLPNIRPGRSNLKQDVDKENFSYTDTNSDTLSESDLLTRNDRGTGGQGYVLPHPRIGRSTSQKRKKRELLDMDTVIPYPRLGRSQKEIMPEKPPENQNSNHKLNKHMISTAENSVYLLPYPRPGRYTR